MNRRTMVVGGAAILTSMAGCLGVLGEERIEVEANPVRVPESVAEDTGFSFANRETIEVERTFEVLGQTREVLARTNQAEYDKEISVGPLGALRAATFSALATPSVSILGREFNPVGEMSTRELAEMVQDQYEEIENLEHQHNETIPVAGADTTVSSYIAEAELVGEVMDIYLYISEAAALGDDLVIAIGAFPEIADEAENIRTLMAAIETDE